MARNAKLVFSHSETRTALRQLIAIKVIVVFGKFETRRLLEFSPRTNAIHH